MSKPVSQSVLAAVRRASRRLAAGRVPAHLRAAMQVDGMISVEEAELLFRLASRLSGTGCIVEIGSFRGRSTLALAQGAGSCPVFAIDPHEHFAGALGGRFGPQDRAAFFRAMLRSGAYERVRLVNLPSQTVAPGWREPVKLLWLDGDHSYDGVRSDWRAWRPHLAARALVAVDDSTDRRLGPHRLVAELLSEQEFRLLERVGKVTALQRLR